MTSNDKQVQNIQKQIENLSEQLRNLVTDNAQPIIDQAASTAKDYAEQAGDYAAETGKKMKTYAKENPQQAAGIVGGALVIAGLVVYLMNRSDRD